MKFTEKEKTTLIAWLIEIVIIAITLVGVYYEIPAMMFYGLAGTMMLAPAALVYDDEEDR